jgi:hypothetical protein
MVTLIGGSCKKQSKTKQSEQRKKKNKQESSGVGHF